MRRFIFVFIFLFFPFVTLNACSNIPYSTVKDATDPRVDRQVMEVKNVIKNFHFVSVRVPEPGGAPDPLKYGLYRGAIPIAGEMGSPEEITPNLQGKLEEGIKTLHDKLNIKTILDLQTSDELLAAERKAAEKYGVNFISIKLPALFKKPSEERMKQIMAILKNPASYPLYVHCRHGQDRTGLVIGLYRYFVDGMPAQEAYEEMMQLGFHPHFEIGHDCYFRTAVGMPVPSECQSVPTSDP